MAVVSAKLLKNIEESAPKNVFVEISIEFFCPALHYFYKYVGLGHAVIL